MVMLDSFNILVSCDKNGIIKLSEINTNLVIKDISLLTSNSDGIRSLATTNSNLKLISGSEDKTVRLWDL